MGGEKKKNRECCQLIEVAAAVYKVPDKMLLVAFFHPRMTGGGTPQRYSATENEPTPPP